MSNLEIYCVTDKELPFLEKSNYKLAGVGRSEFSSKYIKCDNLDNIYHKEKNYSELTFHYWFWKNLLSEENDDSWIGFCQKRRYWIQERDKKKIDRFNLDQYLLSEIDETKNIEALICEPINTNGIKKIKLLKRGWRNLLKKPLIFTNEKHQNIELQFDMHHGYGNLRAATQLLNKNDRDDFLDFVVNNTKFNPHIMFISKKKIIQEWFSILFEWLERCEKLFGFENLQGYDRTRIYAYLAERYLSFWFRKYTKYKEQPWAFVDI